MYVAWVCTCVDHSRTHTPMHVFTQCILMLQSAHINTEYTHEHTQSILMYRVHTWTHIRTSLSGFWTSTGQKGGGVGCGSLQTAAKD